MTAFPGRRRRGRVVAFALMALLVMVPFGIFGHVLHEHVGAGTRDGVTLDDHDGLTHHGPDHGARHAHTFMNPAVVSDGAALCRPYGVARAVPDDRFACPRFCPFLPFLPPRA